MGPGRRTDRQIPECNLARNVFAPHTILATTNTLFVLVHKTRTIRRPFDHARFTDVVDTRGGGRAALFLFTPPTPKKKKDYRRTHMTMLGWCVSLCLVRSGWRFVCDRDPILAGPPRVVRYSAVYLALLLKATAGWMDIDTGAMWVKVCDR